MEKNNRIINVCDAFNPHGLSNGIFIPDAICELKTISAYAKACWGKLKPICRSGWFLFPYTRTTCQRFMPISFHCSKQFKTIRKTRFGKN